MYDEEDKEYMSRVVLITGGAGFIGSHLADELLTSGYRVRVLDNLCSQVHGCDAQRPEYLDPQVEFIKGDICNSDIVKKALKGVDVIYHFAAAVGVGQSMYQIQKYTKTNNYGTSVLLENLAGHSIEKLIVASSMSVYGEGLYVNSKNEYCQNVKRSLQQLRDNMWEPQTEQGEILKPVSTPEGKIPSLASVYALSKYDQEQMCLMVASAYNVPSVALRFFNVYGERQALSNPYTGVLAIFASRYLNNRHPVIFEDGYQRRDFVNVNDICKACILVLETEKANGLTFNIGSGKSYTVRDVAHKMAVTLGKEKISPVISSKYRFGDIRHCYSDITLAKKILGYQPSVDLDKGLIKLAQWLEGQIAKDNLDVANAELIERGLAV